VFFAGLTKDPEDPTPDPIAQWNSAPSMQPQRLNPDPRARIAEPSCPDHAGDIPTPAHKICRRCGQPLKKPKISAERVKELRATAGDILGSLSDRDGHLAQALYPTQASRSIPILLAQYVLELLDAVEGK